MSAVASEAVVLSNGAQVLEWDHGRFSRALCEWNGEYVIWGECYFADGEWHACAGRYFLDDRAGAEKAFRGV